MAVQGKARTGGWVLAAIAVAVVLALVTQQALAQAIARLLADLWVSTISAVLKLFASIFGAR